MDDQKSEQILRKLSQQLQLAREKNEMSKQELSKLSGVDRATIRYIENPDENPTILTLIKVALALDLDLGSIISESFEDAVNSDD